MIRIISKEPHKSVVKEVICRNCGATLEYAPVDVKERSGRDYDGGGFTIRYIECPCCNKEIHVSGG